MKDIIVFGTGKYFECKRDTIQQKYHITTFLDNKVNRTQSQTFHDTGIIMINPASMNVEDSTEIFLMSVSFVSMWKQLCNIGVDPKRIRFPYKEEPYFDNEVALYNFVEDITFSSDYFECIDKNGHSVQIKNQLEWREFLRKVYRLNYPLIQTIADMSTVPISRQFGTERGTPIDRFYIGQFLENNQKYICGDVLEIEDSTYTKRYGADRVKQALVMDVSNTSPDVTFLGNLETGEGIRGEIADCFILTQTLMYIFDLKSAAHNIRKLLKKGGRALITCSGISQNSMRCMDNYGCFFNFNKDALIQIFEDEKELCIISNGSYGNVKTVTAHLNGLCCEDLKKEDFEIEDKYYPLIVYAVVEKL